MSILFTYKFNRLKIIELTGLTGNQVDFLKKEGFININKRRYDFKSLLIASLYSEYNKYFKAKRLTNVCKTLLDLIKKRINEDFEYIKNPVLFAFNNDTVILIPVDNLLIANLKRETSIIEKEDKTTCHFQELLLNMDGKSVKIPNIKLSIGNCYKINVNILIKQLENKYIELYNKDINIA